MSRSQHRHEAWNWFRSELERQLGEAGSAALFAEYSRRAKADKRYNDRVDAPEQIARLEARRDGGRADSAELRRLEKKIARLREMIEQKEEQE